MKEEILVLNEVSDGGLDRVNSDLFDVVRETDNPDAILLRSYKLHNYKFGSKLKAIGRAGAGVNNIPVVLCTNLGIAVFNTPGANANAVKELIILSLFLGSRKIVEGLEFVKKLANETDLHTKVEKGKSSFSGTEISGKTLGVIGLGAIGVMVANDAKKLGMKVFGCDPYISVDRAWGLSQDVCKADKIEQILSTCDYISLNVPLNKETSGFIDKRKLRFLKKGAVLLNFARGELVHQGDILDYLNQGILRLYITDFPTQELINNKSVVCLPHLGASTVEAENNCAVMIVDQVQDYLINGNVCNSVNFPNCKLDRQTKYRLIVLNENVPNMVGQIASVLAEFKINITDMLNKSRDNIAYNIIDIESSLEPEVLKRIKDIKGVLMVRLLN